MTATSPLDIQATLGRSCAESSVSTPFQFRSFRCPTRDSGTIPQSGAPASPFDDGSRHSFVTAEISRDAVSMGQAEKIRDLLSIDKVIYTNETCHDR
jgi:hypothetical protein